MSTDHANVSDERTVSLWMKSAALPKAPRLTKSIECNVAIVGSGIAGLSCAYELSRTHRVVVLERDVPGAGETGRTSAHLCTGLDDRYCRLERLYGEEGARLAAESHAQAIDWIERNVAREGIACEFSRVPGYLFLDPSEDRKKIRRTCSTSCGSQELFDPDQRVACRLEMTGQAGGALLPHMPE